MVKPFAVFRCDFKVRLDDSHGCNAPKTHNHMRRDDRHLGAQISDTAVLFLRQRIAVFGRTAFQNVCNVYVATVDSHGIKIFVKQLSCRSDKRNSRFILVLSGRFSDKHQPCVRIACPEHDVCSCLIKLACFACFAGSLNFVECFEVHMSPLMRRLRQESSKYSRAFP